MEKIIKLELNKYPVIPHSLRSICNQNDAEPAISVDLAELFHHYYLDTHGRRPPNPDPSHFEHLGFLMPTLDFKFQGTGLGVSASAKRSRSCELGQAFCRWFLHEHLNITYFAHMGDLLNRQMHRAFEGCTIKRVKKGDSPDYFCAENVNRVYLAEAKGRYTSISFANKEFDDWREQFNRVRIYDASGTMRSVKGHIVATRFATEAGSASIHTTLYAEDPESPGSGPLEGASATSLGAAILGSHYGHIAEKLNQPLLASALINGISLPTEIRIQAMLWSTGFNEKTYVGGYFADPNWAPPFIYQNGKFRDLRFDPLRLDVSEGIFFGIEEDIFHQIIEQVRSIGHLDEKLYRLEPIKRVYSGISMLRDGSVIGPINFFNPVRSITL